MKLLELLIHNTNKLLNRNEFKNSTKKNPNNFTHTRKMPFKTVALFMLTRFKSSTQNTLRKFFHIQNNPTTIKQQTFSEARAKIKPDALITLFRASAHTIHPLQKNLSQLPTICHRCKQTKPTPRPSPKRLLWNKWTKRRLGMRSRLSALRCTKRHRRQCHPSPA